MFNDWTNINRADVPTVERWWASTPNANVGILTGVKSGLFVFDIDPKNGGNDTYSDLLAKHGQMPDTWEVITGSGGRHCYFRYPAFPVRNVAGLFGPTSGIDIRGDGGQVVAPPSIHPETGKTYEWDGLRDIESFKFAEAPAWLLEALEARGRVTPQNGRAPVKLVPEKIPGGTRNHALVAMAGNMRRMGLTAEEIFPSLQFVNQTRCDPPEDLAAVHQISQSMMRYRPQDNDLFNTSARLWRLTKKHELEAEEKLVRLKLEPQDGLSVYRSQLTGPAPVIDRMLYNGLTILAGKSKAGKAQPLDAKILTPYGWILMGDVKLGHQIIGANGKATTVTAIHPQGIQPCYHVVFSDGACAETTGEHLWRIKDQNHRFTGHEGLLRTTEEISEMLMNGKLRHTFVPMVDPIEFAKPTAPIISHYLLGVLLGDGGLTKDVTITSGDPEIFEYVKDELPVGVSIHHRPHKLTISLRTTSRKAADIKRAPMVIALRSMGLMGKGSHDKFIPLDYLRGSVDERLDLLRGLLDTDGTISKRGGISFYTTSRRLADDFTELVQSLGGTIWKTLKHPNFKDRDGNTKAGRLCYVLRVKIPIALGSPFRLKRKTARWSASRHGSKKPPARKIELVSYSRHTETQCITVSAEDGLYVTNDFIVTHNSWIAMQLALSTAMHTSALGERQVLRPGGVVYYSLEMGENRTAARLRQLMASEDITLQNIEFVWDCLPMAAGGMDQLSMLLETKRPSLVVIDTFMAFAKGKQKESGDVMRGQYGEMDLLKKLSEKHETALLLVHHTRKTGAWDTGDEGVDLVAGSRGVTAACDSVWILRKQPDDLFALDITGRDVEEQSLAVKFGKDPLGWVIIGDADSVKRGNEDSEILSVVSSEGHVTIGKICSTLRMQRPKAQVILQRLNQSGMVGKKPNGTYYIRTDESEGAPWSN